MDPALSLTPRSVSQPSELTYERLKFTVNEIRLIIIEPLEDTIADAVLTCSLEHHILESAPRFFALSYNWGDPEDTELIYVNNCIFHATRNLFEALKALRAHGRVLVWADALCINQKDYEERALQLLRMGSIYRAASEVCIWLGLADEDIANAVNHSMLKATTGQGFLSERWFYDKDSVQDSEKPSRDDFIEVEHTLQPDVVQYLQAALSRPYRERLWILQEVSVASRIVVFYGCDATDWHTFTATFVAARVALPDAFSRLETLISLRQNILDNSPPFFFTALWDTYASKATIPRDRLYGLLGVTLDGVRLFPAPSYEQSYTVIFRDLTVKQVLSQKSLDFILLRGRTSLNNSEMPSWVPDWLTVNPSSYEWRIAQHIRASLQRKRTFATAERWHASRYTVIDTTSLSVHGARLRLRAQYIATIGPIGPPYGVSFGSLTSFESHSSWGAGIWSKFEPIPPLGMSCPQESCAGCEKCSSTVPTRATRTLTRVTCMRSQTQASTKSSMNVRTCVCGGTETEIFVLRT